MPPAPCPPDFHGVKASTFQACFDHYAALNYWPETLSSTGGYLAGSFRPGASRPVWVNQSADQFQQRFNDLAAQGNWPHQVSCTGGGYQLDPVTFLGIPVGLNSTKILPVYTCIWKPMTGPVEMRFLTVTDFAKKNQAMADAGFVLHDFCVYSLDASVKGIRVAATWTTRPHGAWTQLLNMTRDQAVAQFKEMTAKGYQATRFCSYQANEKTYYAALYEQVLNPGEWYLYFNMSAADYQARYNELAPRGLPIRHLCSAAGRYSVIWGN